MGCCFSKEEDTDEIPPPLPQISPQKVPPFHEPSIKSGPFSSESHKTAASKLQFSHSIAEIQRLDAAPTLTRAGNQKEGNDKQVTDNPPNKKAVSPSTRTAPMPGLKSANKSVEEPQREVSPCEPPSTGDDRLISAKATNDLQAKVLSSRSSFSKDLPSLQPSLERRARTPSPLKRSPSINESQSTPQLTRSSSSKGSSPLRSGLHANTRTQSKRKDASDDVVPRAPLHKRSSSRESVAEVPLHKRSSSQDSTTEVSSEAKKLAGLKRTPSIDSHLDASRLGNRSVESDEAMVEFRMFSGKQSSTRKVSTPSRNPSPRCRSPSLRNAPGRNEAEISSSINRNSSRKKEQSPVRLSSTEKAASVFLIKAADRTSDPLHSQNTPDIDCPLVPTQAKQGLAKKTEIQRERLALKDIPGNCMSIRDIVCTKNTSLKQGPKSFSESKENSNNGTFEGCTELQDQDTSLPVEVALGKEINVKNLHIEKVEKSSVVGDKTPPPFGFQRSHSTRSCEQFLFPDMDSLLMAENNGLPFDSSVGGFTMPASISKACSILKAVAGLNMTSSIQLEKDQSEQQVDQQPRNSSFQIGDSPSPKGECPTEHVRHSQPKEAAVEVFAISNSQPDSVNGNLEDLSSRKDLQFSALKAMKLSKMKLDDRDISKLLGLIPRADSNRKAEELENHKPIGRNDRGSMPPTLGGGLEKVSIQDLGRTTVPNSGTPVQSVERSRTDIIAPTAGWQRGDSSVDISAAASLCTSTRKSEGSKFKPVADQLIEDEIKNYVEGADLRKAGSEVAKVGNVLSQSQIGTCSGGYVKQELSNNQPLRNHRFKKRQEITSSADDPNSNCAEASKRGKNRNQHEDPHKETDVPRAAGGKDLVEERRTYGRASSKEHIVFDEEIEETEARGCNTVFIFKTM